jgi:hypothetical protein
MTITGRTLRSWLYLITGLFMVLGSIFELTERVADGWFHLPVGLFFCYFASVSFRLLRRQKSREAAESASLADGNVARENSPPPTLPRGDDISIEGPGV